MPQKKSCIPWNKGKKLSEEHKKKIGETLTGRIVSEETRKKLSEANSGENNPMWGRIAEKSSRFGKKHSEETKKKISEANKGKLAGEKNPQFKKQRSEEHRKKLSESHKGNHPSEETKKRISESLSGKNSPNFGKRMSGETKEKISKKKKGKPSPNKGIRHPELSGENNPNYIDGRSFEPYCPKFNERLKHRIRERDIFTCQLCGVKENGRKHSCHHVHYDKHNCYPDLITLCVSCNSIANGNRDYYEQLFMNKLNERGLLYWTCRIDNEEILNNIPINTRWYLLSPYQQRQKILNVLDNKYGNNKGIYTEKPFDIEDLLA